MRPPHDPGPLVPAHRLLIASGVAAAVLYAAWETSHWLDGTDGSWWRALVAALAAVGLAFYLRSLRRLPEKLSGRPPRGPRER